jgi:hypothetical protein
VALWPGLALLTYLGKGLVIWGAYSLYLGLLWALSKARRFEVRTLSLHRTTALVLAPLVPTAIWLGLAQATLFSANQLLLTDLGPVPDVLTNVRRLTLGYGNEAQGFMVASWREALYVYTDFAAWPTLCLVAVPALFALGHLGVELARGLARREWGRTTEALLPLCLVVPPAAVILGKGALDVRFHLLYLPVLLPHAAGAFDAWARCLERGRGPVFLVGGLAGWGYVLWTQARAGSSLRGLGWTWPAAGAITLVFALAAFTKRGVFRQRAGALALVPLGLYALWSSLAFGVLDWGQRWAWEPSAIREDQPRDVRSFPGPEVQLGECFLSRQDTEGARPHIIHALEQYPEDRGTLLQAGEMLLRVSPRDAERVLRAVSDYGRRHPEDEQIRQLLDRSLAAARRRSR